MESIINAKKHAKILAKKNKLKLKDALEFVAHENDFSDWKSYKNSLDTFWYAKSSPFLNHWFSLYSEAKAFLDNNSGFLLTYKGQYFIASRDYIKHLGLDPDSEIWKVIEYDVSRPHSLEKFYNYYLKLKGDRDE